MGQTSSSSVRLREAIRLTIRVVLSLWALLSLPFLYGGFTSESDTGVTIRLIFAAIVLMVGIGPLVGHILWGRRHPILERAPSRAVQPATFAGGPFPAAPPDPTGQRAKLHQIQGAAQQLVQRGWIEPHAAAAVHTRITRLAGLVEADERSLSFGGSASAGVRREVAELHRIVIDLLDASIEAGAVSSGDQELDVRLQGELDRIVSRGEATAHLEGRSES